MGGVLVSACTQIQEAQRIAAKNPPNKIYHRTFSKKNEEIKDIERQKQHDQRRKLQQIYQTKPSRSNDNGGI